MAAGMATAREKAKIQNSLLTLIQALQGEVISVELRNESSVTGVLNSVDMYMNLTMSHVEFSYTNGSTATFEQFYVQGHNVRYIPIPSHIDMKLAVEAQLKGYQAIRENKKRTENWIKKHKRREAIKRKTKVLTDRLNERERARARSSQSPSVSDAVST